MRTIDEIRARVNAEMLINGVALYTIDNKAREGETSDFTRADGSVVAMTCHHSGEVETDNPDCPLFLNLWQPVSPITEPRTPPNRPDHQP